MRVCVDGRSLVREGRGVAHYTSALLAELQRLYPGDDWVVVVPRGSGTRAAVRTAASRPGAPPSVPQGGKRVTTDGAPAARVPGPLALLGAATVGRPRIDRIAGGCDVVWVPAPAPVAVSSGVPVVLTVHDRSWEERPSDFTAYERLWHVATRPRAVARRAAVVMTTTTYGRRDLIDAWGLDPERVRPVPLAAAVGGAARAVDVDDPYFLFVGALEPRKAPDVLAAAVALARADGLGARVVVVGSGRVPVPGCEVVGRVDDARLASLYAGALALVAPSRLEGFGLPAVEALGCGTPAIVTDLAPVREVLGDRARYVPVDDPRALADALLEYEAPRSVEPWRGLTWEATARATYSALAEAAAGARGGAA